MKKVFLGLGSDLGDREDNLKRAVESIGALAGIVTGVSPVYETEPVGFSGNRDFLNMVISIETNLTPSELLDNLMMSEKHLGRTRGKSNNISRTIDIDILIYDDLVIDNGSLVIPHPRMHERRFVLVPLHDIAPDLVHPVLGKTISELLAECSDTSRIRPFKSDKTLFKSTSP
jgi:2-amino-4-hydroxy-6-hydroxymethyldihydropteridine diphosphokinase